MIDPPADASVPEKIERGLAAAFRPKDQDDGPTDAPSVLDRLRQRTDARLGVDLPEPERERGEPVVRIPRDGGEAPRKTPRYHISGELARGGLGIVYRGRDQDLGREVAVKVLHPDFADHDDILARFVEEAQIGGQLQHPGIVPVYELGLQHDHQPFFAMKLVKGETLAALLSRRSSPRDDRRRFLSIFEQVCQTIAYAHARRVVHRDLKPANVMVGAFGEVQVIDWGFAKVLGKGGVADEERVARAQAGVIATARSASGTRSVAGSVMGTPGYMPPEQAAGRVEAMDERSDVFALGAVLCEILTGGPPFTGSKAETLKQAAACATSPALERLRASAVDAELEALVADCLQEDPSARPSSAEVVAARIGNHLASVEERARQAEVRSAQAKLRAKLVTGLAAAVLTLVTAGAGGYLWWKGEEARHHRAVAREVGQTLEEARTLHGMAKAALEADGASELGLSRYAAAIADAEKAVAMAGEGDAAVRADASSFLRELREDQSDAAKRARGIARDRSLRDAIIALRFPMEDDMRQTRAEVAEARRFDREYAAAFRAHGVDVDALSPDRAAEDLRGIANVEIAAGLADWALQRRVLTWRGGKPAGSWHHLIAVARALDGDDDWRTRLYDEVARDPLDRRALKSLRYDAKGLDVPPVGYLLLSEALWYTGRGETVAVLEDGQERHPGDFLLTFWLGFRSELVGDAEASLRMYTAARALRPDYLEVWHRMVCVYQYLQRDMKAALRMLDILLEREPNNGHWHFHLAAIFKHRMENERALGEYERALELEPRNPKYLHNYGVTLLHLLRHDEAIAAFERAIELSPRYALAYCSLGLALIDKGRWVEAARTLRRGHELGSRQENWSFPSADWLADAVQRAEREPRLLALAAGDASSEDGSEWAEVGWHQYQRGNYRASLRAYEKGFALAPGLADDLRAQHRYDAACSALLLAAGKGGDEPPDEERAHWRARALGWLRADLELWRARIASGKREAAVAALRHWTVDPDLASVRDAELAVLPEDEPRAWKEFWILVRKTAELRKDP